MGLSYRPKDTDPRPPHVFLTAAHDTTATCREDGPARCRSSLQPHSGRQALTMVSQDVQGAGVPRQGAQALGPAAADRGRCPGRSAPRAHLPEEPRQQLPLLGRGEGRGDLDGQLRGSCLGPSRNCHKCCRHSRGQLCPRRQQVATSAGQWQPRHCPLPPSRGLREMRQVLKEGSSTLSLYL